MDDIDEGIGSNDGVPNSKDTLLDMQNGLDVIKGLNGQAIHNTHINKIPNDVGNTEIKTTQTKTADEAKNETADEAMNETAHEAKNETAHESKNGSDTHTETNGHVTIDSTEQHEDDNAEMEVDMDTSEHMETSDETAQQLDKEIYSKTDNDDIADISPETSKICTNESPQQDTDSNTEAFDSNTFDDSEKSNDKLDNSVQSDSDKDKTEVDKTLLIKSSQFLINDKVRRSLKGLTEKVKASPDKNIEPDKLTASVCDNGPDIGEINDEDTMAEGNVQSKLKKTTVEETNSAVEDTSDNNVNPETVTNEEVDSTKISDQHDAILAAVSDEGFVLDVESEVEDELLRSPEANKTSEVEESTPESKEDDTQMKENANDHADEENGSLEEESVNDVTKCLESPTIENETPVTPPESEESTPSPDGSKIPNCVTSCDNLSVNENSSDSKEMAPAEDDKPVKSIELGSNHQSPIVLDQSDEITETENTNSPMDVDNVTTDVEPKEAETKQEERTVIEDDDDVIFEGETKVNKKVLVSKKPDATLKPPPVSVPKTSNSKEIVKDSIILDDDDDVIIEKEIKVKPIKTKLEKNSDLSSKTESIIDSDINKRDKTETSCKSGPGSSTESSVAKPVSLHINGFIVNSSDRKRPAEDNESKQDIKRTKVELSASAKDSKNADIHNSIELSDSEDEVTEGNDKSETGGKDKKEYQATIKTDVKDNTFLKEEKTLILTEKELNAVVMKKVKAYMMSQQDSLIVQMSHRMKELQENNEMWKKQVKDLQNRVFEVTVLQQKLEKRKAATAALRQITTRTVGVQVDDGKTSSLGSNLGRERLHQKYRQSTTPTKVETPISPKHTNHSGGNRTPTSLQMPSPKAVVSSVAMLPLVTAPPGANGMIRLPISHTAVTTASVLTSQPQTSFQVNQGYKAPTVKSLLDTTRVQMTIGSTQSVVNSSSSSVISLIPYHTMVSTTAAAQGLITLPQPVVSPVANTKVVAKTVTIPSPGAGSKVIDLTEDEEGAKTRIVTLAQGVGSQVTGIPQMLPHGTQLIRSALPNAGYQLVFNPTSPSLRPTMMPGMTAVTPTGTVLQTVAPTNVVNLSSPTGTITQGASLARAAAPMAPVVKTPAAPPPQPSQAQKQVLTHPAAFPVPPGFKDNEQRKQLPPKPTLKISRVSQGIVLSWNMTTTLIQTEIANYQLFAYQESTAAPSPNLWKKVGDVKALPLPMACTLTQFQVGNKYHFAVRAVDVKGRIGLASDASSIYLTAVPGK